MPNQTRIMGGLLLSLLGCQEVVLSDQPPGGDGGLDGGKDMKSDGGISPTTPAWRWESPQPQGNNLRSIWGIPGTTVNEDELVLGGNGTLLVGGTTGWKPQVIPSLGSQAVLGLSGQGSGPGALVFGVGVYDTALRRQAGAWADLNPLLGTGDGNLTAVWATPTAGQFLIAGTTGRLYLVTGSQFVREGMGVTPDSLFAVHGTGTGPTLEAYAVGANGRIVHRLPGASTWMIEANNLVASQLSGVWCGDGPSAGQVLAVGNAGTLLQKSGGNWGSLPAVTAADLTSVWGAGDETFVGGAGGTLLYRKGATWKVEAPALTSELISALWGTVRAGQPTVYAVGNQGTILRRDNGTWSSLSTRVTTASLSSVWARSAQDIFAVGAEGTILRRTGSTEAGIWSREAMGQTQTSLSAIHGYVSGVDSDVYAVGSEGTILHRAGTSWVPEAVAVTQAELTAVWVGADSVWVVGLGGRILKKVQGAWSFDSGPGPNPLNDDLFAVWGSGQGTSQVTYVAGANNVIFRRSGGVWTNDSPTLTPVQTIVALFGATEEGLYALGQKGAVLQRTAGRWQPVAFSGFSGSSAGIAGSLAPGGGGFAIGTQGMILKQTGTLWLPEPPVTSQRFSSVAALSPTEAYIVGANGLILHRY